ncbi:Lymphokine-activated killer T-cell-originated protein kinase [Harpegnathos saltator]|uniref:Lymphokine-activated killer T-cell-originated protein kinase n=2 Tax=Harpegnathos saltator TaxID=610380 RepID=E2BBZ0_HARSA|nr:Lymphokine-activated killer T-cell-originated protein kinase [Harpegnathos saltator]
MTNTEFETPIKIPASPCLERIGCGTGVGIYMLERSPKVGIIRSPWVIKKWLNGQSTKENNKLLKLEADVLRQLVHPNIVGFRAFTPGADGKPCLAMEALDISLGNVIEEKHTSGDDTPFAAKDILKVGYEVAKGLKYLHHKAHILHGDIKSPNILIDHSYSVVKICDFGHSMPLTKSLELDTSKANHSYIGTTHWNAPEIIRGDGPVTNAADIWPYGIVIWEMLTLSVPHMEYEDESSSDSESVSERDSMNITDDSNYDTDKNVTSLKKKTPYKNNKLHVETEDELSFDESVSERYMTSTTDDYNYDTDKSDTFLKKRMPYKNKLHVGIEDELSCSESVNEGYTTNTTDNSNYDMDKNVTFLNKKMPYKNNKPHVETEDESVFDESVSGGYTTNFTDDSDCDMCVCPLKKIHKNDKLGTRPPLPAINFSKEYDRVLEVFYICTNADYKSRPNAKMLVKYFEEFIFINKT